MLLDAQSTAPLIRALLDCVARYKFIYLFMYVCMYVHVLSAVKGITFNTLCSVLVY